jgi:hypothetical protein
VSSSEIDGQRIENSLRTLGVDPVTWVGLGWWPRELSLMTCFSALRCRWRWGERKCTEKGPLAPGQGALYRVPNGVIVTPLLYGDAHQADVGSS